MEWPESLYVFSAVVLGDAVANIGKPRRWLRVGRAVVYGTAAYSFAVSPYLAASMAVGIYACEIVARMWFPPMTSSAAGSSDEDGGSADDEPSDRNGAGEDENADGDGGTAAPDEEAKK